MLYHVHSWVSVFLSLNCLIIGRSIQKKNDTNNISLLLLLSLMKIELENRIGTDNKTIYVRVSKNANNIVITYIYI